MEQYEIPTDAVIRDLLEYAHNDLFHAVAILSSVIELSKVDDKLNALQELRRQYPTFPHTKNN